MVVVDAGDGYCNGVLGGLECALGDGALAIEDLDPLVGIKAQDLRCMA